VLHLGRVLETAVDNSLQALRLQDEIIETARVDANVVALLGLLSGVCDDLGGLLVLQGWGEC